MQCIRSVVGGPSGGAAAAAAGSAVERKILIKTEDSRGLAHGERGELAERRSREEGTGQQEAPDDKKAAGTAPEVRTFVLGENQCIVYGARPGDGSRPAASSPSSSSSATLQHLPISHLPPKKTLKLALGLRGGPLSPSASSRQPSPPPLTLRRTSDEPDRMLARIQIVSRAHPGDEGEEEDQQQQHQQQSGVVVTGGQGVHVIRDGRFYQPQQQQRHEEAMVDEEPEDAPHGQYHVPQQQQQQHQHSSIIVANGGRSSPLSHQGRLSPAGSGCGGAAVQHPHTSSSITTTTTILVSNERASIYKPPTQATSTTTTTVSRSKQQQQQQHGHVTSMQPPPPPPPLKMSKGGGGGGGAGHEEPSSSMPDLEFDGTTVLCRVCGDKASGFHYGVHSCEGCKGFFRRSIQQKIQYRPCTKNQQCSILRINRNRCQYCRLKKCIAVGMSRDAVRFGRVPKREKARILAAMQQSTQNRGNQRALASELDDQPRLLASVLQAHIETCEFTREKVAAMRQRARDCPSYSMPTLACPLNPAPELQSEQEFSQRFAHVIRGVIDFAGMIPGFQLLTQDDKFTLLKAGLFDALFVRLICMFDTSINSIICLNGQVMRRDTIQNGANARFLVDSTFNFAERMNSMQLTDAEIGLFCAIVLITPDRPGLRNVELIERMYTKLKACLQSVITQNRPDKPEFMQELLRTMPDLRTLSTLHTEKLVVFRTEHKELLRQQMWSAEEDQGAVLDAKSPASWSCDGNQVEVEIAKSPMSSVSSTESTETSSSSSSSSSSSEYHHLHHHHHQHGGISSAASAAAPLLAATLSGACPIIRHRASSGSSAEDDLIGGTAQHLAQNGLTITPVIRSVGSSSSSASSASSSSASSGAGASHLHHHHHHHHVSRYRKLDSPTDSGIESGNEKHDNPSPQQQQQQLHHQQHHHLLLHPKPASSSVSSGSSSCSSPRSSLEDPALEDSSSSSNGKAPSLARHASVDNMPVLKRVLQAPPLYDTNSLMDEAYKPHKKFRAMRHRESEAEAASSSTTTTSASAAPSPSATVLASSSSPRPASVPQPQQSVVAIAAPSPPQQPAQQPPQHHQSQLHMHLTRPQTTQSHQSSAAGFLQSTSARSSPQPPQQQQQHHHAYSSLSSTHSVLAKSLMEEPRMTPEQMKRTDIIHNYIMRESAQEQQQNYIKQQQQQQQGGLLVCGASAANGVFQRASPHLTVSAVSPAPSSSSSSGSSPAAAAAPTGGCPFGGSSSSASAGRWQQVIPAVTASVITTTGGHRAQQTPSPGSLTPPDTSSSSSSSSLSVVSSPPSAASPSSSSSSATSIRYFQSPHSTMTSPAPPASPSSVVVVAPPHTPSPRLIELKVDIGSSATATTSLDPCHQQPLNLSKKSPSPAPTPVSVVQRSIVGGPSALSPVGAATTVVVATSSSSNAATSSSSSNNPTIHKILLEA